MIVLIEKLKISNFLSFFGEYEVNFKPFSAIMCNFYEGKDDLFRVFEFVFGAHLSDLRVQNPLDLVNKILREEFLVNRDTQVYVEVTLNLLLEKKQVKLSRSIKNGTNSTRIEHKISGLVTSSVLYREKLSSLGINIKEKNLIFHKNFFDRAIWGSAEELEMIICNCLREAYLLEDWKKAKKEVEHLTKLKRRAAEKNYNAMKKSHLVMEEYTDKYKGFCANREKALGRFLLDITNDSSSEGTLSEIESSRGEMEVDVNKTEKAKVKVKMDFLAEELHNLKLKEARMISRLYHEEIKLAAMSGNANLLQNRIRHLKLKFQEKEKKNSEIWDKIQGVKSDLEAVGLKISFTLIALRGYQISGYRQNRFTRYGRFYDYLQFSRYVRLLKQIIGEEIFYAHLCDSIEEAFSVMKQVRNLRHENREVFLPFENYSPKLKDIITASGEKGIKINNLEEFLIFLCKLKHYNVIEEVPVIVQKDFNFDNVLPEGYTIYINSNIHCTNDGLISCKVNENDFTLDGEKELHENLIELYMEQELKYRDWNALWYSKWETLTDMNILESDIYYFKQEWRKYIQKPQVVRECAPLPEIYEEYRDIFKEHTDEREKSESELQQEEELLFEEKECSISSSEDILGLILRDLEDIIGTKIKVQKELDNMNREAQLLDTAPIHVYNIQRNVIKFRCNNFDKTELFFEKEFKMLSELIEEDDMEDFFGSQEWRKGFITSLIRDFNEIKKKLKESTEELQNIATARKTKLYQLFDHCSRYLSSTFSHILDDALPFVKIDFDPGEETIHIKSCLGEEKINIIDIKHFNTLLKFISALSVFLEIAKFHKTPFMILDDVEDYFPNHLDDLSAVLELKNLEKILPANDNPRFSLLIRVGQFLKHYIKKNTPGRLVRNNGNQIDYTSGPVQIIYFAKEDLIHAAEHYIWIQNQILPEEYMTEDCNSYSEIHEINLETLNNY